MRGHGGNDDETDANGNARQGQATLKETRSSPFPRSEEEGSNAGASASATPEAINSSPGGALGSDEKGSGRELTEASLEGFCRAPAAAVSVVASAVRVQRDAAVDARQSGEFGSGPVVVPLEHVRGDGAGFTPSWPLPPPSTPAPIGSAGLARRGGFDLLTLDPAARDFLLAQQRQLLALEEQLLRLQTTMLDQKHWRSLQQHQHQHHPSSVRLSVEKPLLSTGSLLLARTASTAAAAERTSIENVEQRTAGQQVEAALGGRAVKAAPAMDSGKEAAVVEASTTAEASTNTSFLWGAPLSAAEKSDRGGGPDPSAGVAASASSGSASATPKASDSPAPAPRGEHEHAGQSQDAGDGEARPDTPLPSGPSETQTPISPGDVRASANGWTTQRGRAVDETRRANDESGRARPVAGDDNDAGSSCSGSEDNDERLEAPRLGLSLPGFDVGAASRAGARRPRPSQNSWTTAVVVDPASDDDSASGTVGVGGVERQEVDDRRKRVGSVRNAAESWGSIDDEEKDGRGSDGGFVGGRGSRQRRPLAAAAVGGGRWRNAPVGPIPIADLVVVPRIEYGLLTDDELGSDLDEGEVRGYHSIVLLLLLFCYHTNHRPPHPPVVVR